jgi:predicted MFS family arabinose efflux permease
VGLLSTTLTFLLFYLSSRPITGMPPLQDWRLGLLTILSLIAFVYYEQRKKRPFIRLHILKNRSLTIASLCALLRMMTLSGGLGFIMPLYLADIVNLTPTQSGFFLMANPAAMVIFVHLGGRLSDTLGSRTIGMIGFLVFSGVMGVLSRLPVEVPYWVIIATLLVFGAGAGFMLAAFHRAALNFVSEEDLGTASGLYSMIRFMGSALGAAVGGILLQFYSEQNNTTTLSAYQHVFIWFIGFTLIGFAIATLLPKER